MATTLNFIRASIFYTVLIISLLFAGGLRPLFRLIGTHPKKVARWWFIIMHFMIWHVCGIRYVLKGNLPKNPAFFAVQHQSAWETLVLAYILKTPAFILKKELLSIPIFGSYLRSTGMIAIDREAGRKSLEQVTKSSEQSLKAGQHVVIFPEGTRVKYGARGRIRSGVVALYESGVAPVYPVTLDSGRLWPRHSFLKKPGTVTVTIHPPIPKGLPRAELVAYLEKLYYD